jgi:hypothetical protein
MTQTVILLSVSKYQIPDDKGNIENDGTTVRYLLCDDLTPCETQSAKGRVPAKAILPYADYEKFKTVPGFYEATLDYKVDSKGKAALTVTEFEFISPIALNKGFGGGKAAGFGSTKDKE